MASPRVAAAVAASSSSSRQPSPLGSASMEDVWREISAASSSGGADAEVTLEDFLARAGAVAEEDVAGPFPEENPLENPILRFGNGVEAGIGGRGGGGGGGGRGRKRPALDPVDRAAVQRQKRMIKNRESAARSRERKQAYTVELETLVTQLEEEHAELLRYLEEQNSKRLKQLTESVIPVTVMRKPKRPLRRTCSLQW